MRNASPPLLFLGSWLSVVEDCICCRQRICFSYSCLNFCITIGSTCSFGSIVISHDILFALCRLLSKQRRCKDRFNATRGGSGPESTKRNHGAFYAQTRSCSDVDVALQGRSHGLSLINSTIQTNCFDGKQKLFFFIPSAFFSPC